MDGKEPQGTECGPDLRASRLAQRHLSPSLHTGSPGDMEVVLDLKPGCSAGVLGKFVHEPVCSPPAAAEATLLGPQAFGEGTGSGGGGA